MLTVFGRATGKNPIKQKRPISSESVSPGGWPRLPPSALPQAEPRLPGSGQRATV